MMRTKKLYGVIFQAAGIARPEAESGEIKQVVMKLKNAVAPGGQMKHHECFKTGAPSLLRAWLCVCGQAV